MQAVDSAGLGIERRAAALEYFLDRNKGWVLALLSVLYFAGTILRARGKPFWFDEILSLIAVHQPSLGEAIAASRRLEWGPPGNTVVLYLVNKIAGSGEVAFRIPAMLGFWLFCLCLFAFAKRRVSFFFALTAMLLPFATWGEGYSIEARAYGMVLGWCGVALYCWQTASTEKKHRLLSLTGLTLAIGAAVLTNYYAVLICLPLATAEALRNLKQRRIDWPIWIALILGGIPISSVVLLGRGLQIAHPVALVSRSDYVTFYVNTLARFLWFAVPVLAFVGIWLVIRGDRETPSNADPRPVEREELVAPVLFLLLPLAAITLALAVRPHVFTDRYALPSIAGLALVIAILGAHFSAGRSAIGLMFAAAAFWPFGFALSHGRPLHSPYNDRPMLTDALKDGPVVVTDVLTYLPTWYYAPAEIRQHLLLISDDELSVKYANLSPDLDGFGPYGISLVKYKDLAAPEKPFLIYLTPGFNWWLPKKVLEDGGRVEVLKWEDGQALLLAHAK